MDDIETLSSKSPEISLGGRLTDIRKEVKKARPEVPKWKSRLRPHGLKNRQAVNLSTPDGSDPQWDWYFEMRKHAI